MQLDEHLPSSNNFFFPQRSPKSLVNLYKNTIHIVFLHQRNTKYRCTSTLINERLDYLSNKNNNHAFNTHPWLFSQFVFQHTLSQWSEYVIIKLMQNGSLTLQSTISLVCDHSKLRITEQLFFLFLSKTQMSMNILNWWCEWN